MNFEKFITTDDDEGVAWELMSIDGSGNGGSMLTRRESAIMVSVSDSCILILGGDGESGFQSDAYVLDT